MREIITTQDIRLAHPNNCACATDGYYTRFANNLYDRLRGFVGKDFPDKNFTRTLACKLTCYFEDIVADMGVWRMFSNECMKLYGYPVPMYHAEEEYYPDEPSLNAVRYLVWDVACELFPDRLFETDRLLLEMGQEAYRILDAAFESAPINEEAKTEMNNMLHYASEGFNELRDVLGWMLAGCYITSGRWLNEDMRDKAKEIKDIPVFKQMATSMRQYFILSEMKFNNRIGPLALLPYEWLQRLAVATGNDDLARLLEGGDLISPCRRLQVIASEDIGAAYPMAAVITRACCESAKELGLPEEITVILGGYSLAAFFSLWSGYQTDVFSSIVGVSPSVWFPQWIEFAESHQMKANRVYLSLGDKEPKAKNPHHCHCEERSDAAIFHIKTSTSSSLRGAKRRGNLPPKNKCLL